MDCLRNLIIVPWCGEDTTLLPASGNYLKITSLPGISFKQLAMLPNEEQRNWSGVWDDITLRAAKRFNADFRQLMGKRYKLKTITHAAHLGRSLDNSNAKAGGTEYRGIVIELNNSGDDYYPSVLQQISIDRLFYYHNAASLNGFAFHVFDLDTGVRIDAFTKDVVNGWNTINYGKRFNIPSYSNSTFDYPRRIFIAFQSLGNSTPASDISHIINHEYICARAKISGGYAPIASTVTSVTTGTNTYGLSANITIGCSWENLVCQNQNVVDVPYWYLCGIESMNEVIYTDRFNQYTTIGIPKAKELKDQYEVMYMGGTLGGIQHEGALNQAVDGIDLSLCDECIECDQQITIRESVL